MKEKSTLHRVNIFGFNFVSASNYDSILDEIRDGIELQGEDLPVMITPNVDQTVKFHKSEKVLRERFKHAKYILPDGQPLVTLSRWKKQKRLASRLTGSDFFPQIWTLLKAEKQKVSFIVSNETIADALEKENALCSSYIPPFFDHKNANAFEQEVDACIQMIKREQPSHLFIGLGFPKQEYLCAAILDRLKETNQKPPFFYLLGASMEFYTRKKKRAPKIFQKLGVEFLHRLFSDPKRMAKRYLIDDLSFIPIAWREIVKKEV